MNKNTWILLVILLGLSGSFMSISRADSIADTPLMHLSPVPEYLKIISQYDDAIKITDYQESQLIKWREKYRNYVTSMSKRVITLEKEIKLASVQNATTEQLTGLLDELLQMRRRISLNKIKCGQNVQKVLTDEQWNKMLSLYIDDL